MALLTLLGMACGWSLLAPATAQSFPDFDGHVAAVGVRPSDRTPGLVRLPAD